jgi:hypothetical protein
MGEVSTDDHFAASLCVIVIVITLLLFFMQRFLAKRYAYSMTALKPMQAEPAQGSQKFFAYLFVYGIAFIAMLPQLTVIFTSFLETAGGAVYTGNFSLMNYMNTLFAKDNNSILNTYLFGLVAIVVVVVMGILISYLTVRKPSLLTGILDTLTMFPYIIPGSVLGIALLSGFNSGSAGPERYGPYHDHFFDHQEDALYHSFQYGDYFSDQSQRGRSSHQPGRFGNDILPEDHGTHDAAGCYGWRHHELDYAHQRIKFQHHPVHQFYQYADRGHLCGSHPQQFWQCGGLFHHPDPDFYPVPAAVLQIEQEPGYQRVNLGVRVRRQVV